MLLFQLFCNRCIRMSITHHFRWKTCFWACLLAVSLVVTSVHDHDAQKADYCLVCVILTQSITPPFPMSGSVGYVETFFYALLQSETVSLFIHPLIGMLPPSCGPPALIQ